MTSTHRRFHLPLLGLVLGLCGLGSTVVASKAIAAVAETKKAGAVSPQGKAPVNPVTECIKRENATNKANNDAINKEYNAAVKAANTAQQSAAKAAHDAYDSAAKAANEVQRAALQSADAAKAASIKAADAAYNACVNRPPPPTADILACQQARTTAISHAAIAYANTIGPVNVRLAAALKEARDQRDTTVKDSQAALVITLKDAKDHRDKILALEKNRHEAALKDCRGQSP